MRALTAYIEDRDIEPSHLDAKSFPSFFRFGNVDIFISRRRRFYEENLETQPFAEKCQLFEDQLQLMKAALNGSIIIFYGFIDQSDRSCFYDHDQVLEYLRNRLFPICDKSRGYDFWIGFYLDANTTGFIIASILQMDQIDRSSNVKIDFSADDRTKLPIEEISNWLHRNGGGQQERSLYIDLSQIENLADVFTHLKEVFILYFLQFCKIGLIK